MIDLDQLAAFVAIAERRTVTAAALKLHRSQSAVSRRLALLEDALGAQLFDRRGTKLALTDVGRAFMPFAERALAAVASGQEAAVAQREPRAGTVSIAIVGTLVDADLARALAGVSFGATRFRVLTGTSTEVSRMVRRGEVNLGVRYLADGDAEIVSEPIGVERMRVVRSPALEDCDRARWIGFPLTRTSKDDFGRLLQRRLAPLGVDYSEVMTVDSLTAQKRLVEAGLGIALLPQSSVKGELQRETLVVADMPAVETTIPIVLVSRRKGYLSPVASDLAAMLGRAFPRD